MRAKSFSMKYASLLIAAALGITPAYALAQDPPQDPRDMTGESDAVAASDDPDAAKADEAKVPLDEIRRYVMVYNAVKQAYVDPVDDRALMQSAVRGLLLDLDPHSAYLQKADADEFNEQTRGAYDGVGLELQQLPEADHLRIEDNLDGFGVVAMIAIGRVRHLASAIANPGRLHARNPAQQILHPPKAASGQDRAFR